MSRSSVVCKYGCPLCGDQYVGSTSRALFVRASEHGGRSHRTGALLTCPPHSAIRVHCEQACLSPVSYDNFKILEAAPDLVNLRILDSLHIFKSKPKLYDSDTSFPLNIVHYFFLFIIFFQLLWFFKCISCVCVFLLSFFSPLPFYFVYFNLFDHIWLISPMMVPCELKRWIFK